MKKEEDIKKWIVTDRNKRILIDTDDLDYAWEVCEKNSKWCALFVINREELETD